MMSKGHVYSQTNSGHEINISCVYTFVCLIVALEYSQLHKKA